jgi:hypothetical protein
MLPHFIARVRLSKTKRKENTHKSQTRETIRSPGVRVPFYALHAPKESQGEESGKESGAENKGGKAIHFLDNIN